MAEGIPDSVDSAPTYRLGYLLKRVQQSYGDRVRAALSPLGIDTRHWSVLITLDDRRALAQTDIGQRAGIDRTTLVAVLDRMESDGLVRREPAPGDRRKNLLSITPAGRKLRNRAAVLVDETEREFLSALGAEGDQRLKSDLGTVLTASISSAPEQ